jgi:hypothetical protein
LLLLMRRAISATLANLRTSAAGAAGRDRKPRS